MIQDEETSKHSVVSADVRQYLLSGRYHNSHWGAVGQLAQSVLRNWSDKSLHQKTVVIHDVVSAIQSAKRETPNEPKAAKAIAHRIGLLKNALAQGQRVNWQEHLLGMRIRPLHSLFYQPLTFDNNATKAVDQKDKSRFYHAPGFFYRKRLSLVHWGSTFVTNRADLVGKTSSHWLDAVYGGLVFSEQGNGCSVLLALGDGSGGHFGDEVQDKAIARTAHVATKACARLLAAYSDPDALKKDIPWVLTQVQQTLQIKGLEEGTTLIALRAFRNDQGYRLVGLNLGDSMVVVWDKARGRLQTLSPGRVRLLNQENKEATAIFPTSYQPHEVQIIDAQQASGDYMMALSDGIYDHLPCHKTKGCYDTDDYYQDTFLDGTDLADWLTSQDNVPPVNAITRALLSSAVAATDDARSEALLDVTRAEQLWASKKSELENRFNEISVQLKQLEAAQQNDESAADKTDDTSNQEGALLAEKSKIQEESTALLARQRLQLGDDITLLAIRLPKKPLQDKTVCEEGSKDQCRLH